MRFSPFRPGASRNEKLYTLSMLSWVLMTAMGWVYFGTQGVHFGPAREIVPIALGLSLLVGVLCWLPMYRDRHPMSSIAARSPLVRVGVLSAMLLALVMLAWATFALVLGPLITISFGTPSTAEYVVSEKSSGRPDRRSCNYFVWLRGEHAWLAKICLPREVWAEIEVRDVIQGAGHSSMLGRTIEQIDWKAHSSP